MKYWCPNCGECFTRKDDEEPLPVHCPECGADLYLEEVLYQLLLSDPESAAAV